MIVNELQYAELLDFLRPILRLESRDTITQNFKSILKMPTVRTTVRDPQHEKPLLKYKGYKLDVEHIRWFDTKGVAIQPQFKARKKWWHGIFKDQNGELLSDLKRICTSEICQLTFERYTQINRARFCEEPQELVFLHDARALNRKWRSALDISPILIAPDAHHGNCFVEFFFWAGGYFRFDGLTELRPDWLDYAYDVSDDIEQEAKRRMGIR